MAALAVATAAAMVLEVEATATTVAELAGCLSSTLERQRWRSGEGGIAEAHGENRAMAAAMAQPAGCTGREAVGRRGAAATLAATQPTRRARRRQWR